MLRITAVVAMVALAWGCGSDLAAGGDIVPGLGGGAGVGGNGGAGASFGCDNDPTCDASKPTATLQESAKSRGSGGGGGLGGAGGGAGTGPSLSLPTACQNVAQDPILLTAAVSDGNAWGSASWAREMLSGGLAPIPQLVRTQDFLQFYRISAADDVAATGMVPVLSVGYREVGGIPGLYDFVALVEAPGSAPSQARSLVLVVDTGPSMTGAALERAKATLGALSGTLSAGHQVTLLTTDPSASVQNFTVTGPSDPALAAAIKQIAISDTTDMVTVLAEAMQHARSRAVNGANRLFVISAGEHDAQLLEDLDFDSLLADNIFATGISVVPAQSYGDRFLRALSKSGRGHFLHIDSTASAGAIISTRASELYGYSFDNIRLTLHLPWYLRRVAETDETLINVDSAPPQYLAPGGVHVFIMRFEACSPDILLETSVNHAVYANAEYTLPGGGPQKLVELSGPLTDFANSGPWVDKALAVRAYADALKSLDVKRLKGAKQAVTAAISNSSAPDLTEISGLLDQHPLLVNGTSPQ